MKKIRCAIYTRKSSEEGLEQDFNSLHAQQEACAAYVLSQASEGWSLLPDRYDDGGLSGGSLERPALQLLLADVAAGRIDIIVVYKVDRLTRSLLDFAKLVEAFDKAGTSFVSVTQSFNTTTSMGRLTLNMLLSFAQFEREVTAERIRDKIAASKAKGMWMGGTPPLGYCPNGRSLAIIKEHAEIVRDIYQRYLTLGNVRVLAAHLAREGINTPQRISGKGRKFGGCPFSRGQLYAILKNPIYVGDVVHREQTYSGQQPAIIDRETWSHVQEQLAENVRGERRARSASPSLLPGMIVDEAGEPLVAAHACKGKVRYRYYVSRPLQHGGDAASAGIRVPAREIEGLVAEQLAELFDDAFQLSARAGLEFGPAELSTIRERCRQTADALRKQVPSAITDLLHQVRVHSDRLEIDVSVPRISGLLGASVAATGPTRVTLCSEVRLTRTGQVVRLVHTDGGAALPRGTAPSLVRLLLRGRRWWSMLAEGQLNVEDLAGVEGVTASYVTRVVRLAFLAPTVVEAALDGRLKADVDTGKVTSADAVACSWTEQMSRFLHSRGVSPEGFSE